MLEKHRTLSSNFYWIGLLCLVVGILLSFATSYDVAMFAGLVGAFCLGASLLFKIRGFVLSEEIAGVRFSQRININTPLCFLGMGIGGLLGSTLMFMFSGEVLPIRSLVFALAMFFLASYSLKKINTE